MARSHAFPLRAVLAALLLSTSQLAIGCGQDSPVEIELRVTSDRGEGFDRLHRIRVHADGCVAVRRPPFHRVPGEFSAPIDAARLAPLRQRLSDPALRALDPQRALAEAQASLQAHGRASGELRRTYVSHPTGYALRLGTGDDAVELMAESIFQQAELYPGSTDLAQLAETIREVIALDALPELAAEASK